MNLELDYKLTPEDVTYCNAVVCAGNHAIKYHTLQVVEQCLKEGIPGDFAECGVLYGAHPAIMLRSLLRRGIRNRKVHLFDSFQGIPRATVDDYELQQRTYGLSSGRMESSGISVSPVENTLANLRKWCAYDQALIEVHPGWFQDTLPNAKVGTLAILRVDVDLFESTKVVYQHLYDHVAPSGFVIDDDYGSPDDYPACRKALEDVVENGGDIISVAHVEGQDSTAWWRR